MRIIAHPLQAVTTVLLFAGLAYFISWLLKPKRLSFVNLVSSFLFIFGTVSIVAAIIDFLWMYPPLGWNLDFLVYFHPVVAIGGIVYLIEVVHQQFELTYIKSVIVIIPAMMITLFSRILFIP